MRVKRAFTFDNVSEASAGSTNLMLPESTRAYSSSSSFNCLLFFVKPVFLPCIAWSQVDGSSSVFPACSVVLRPWVAATRDTRPLMQILWATERVGAGLRVELVGRHRPVRPTTLARVAETSPDGATRLAMMVTSAGWGGGGGTGQGLI